jgi:glutathione S-transferase
MPTTRPRHVITESDRIAEALDDAAKRWPADAHNRGRLLVRLVEEGIRVIHQDHDRRQTAWVEAVRETAGVLPGVYGSRYLEELREDWPE